MCDQSNKNCIYHKFEKCKNLLDTLKPSLDIRETLKTYQQCVSEEKCAEKLKITATVKGIFEDLKSKLNDYVKKMQQAHFGVN